MTTVRLLIEQFNNYKCSVFNCSREADRDDIKWGWGKGGRKYSALQKMLMFLIGNTRANQQLKPEEQPYATNAG